jgi:hypothetical protein
LENVVLQIFIMEGFDCSHNIINVNAQARLDDAEQNALKGGKKAISKMDSRIR